MSERQTANRALARSTAADRGERFTLGTTVLNYFPLQRPGFDEHTFYRQFWQTNMVIHASSRELFYAEHPAPLSIKCAFGGREIYECGAARFAVDDGAYLVMNYAQRYSSYIQSETEVESLTLFFRPGLAEEVLSGLLLPADKLLDDPRTRHAQSPYFFEKLCPHDRLLSPLLFKIRAATKEGRAPAIWLEEQFHVLLERLLDVHRNIYREAERVPAARASARAELYRRLSRAKDYMDSCFQQQLTLSDIAGVACLSTHHFLRLFKQTFKATPHQYLTSKRLEAAHRRLSETDEPVTQVCLSVGFENASAFARIFRSRYGFPPSTLCHRQKQKSNFRTAGSVLHELN